MLTPGTQLGPYDVVAPLGAGGMGEVYRARDSRLGREVALKILPPDRSQDPDRLRRFEREARAVASLNHPHILALYDIGTDGATTYAVFECLEGQTLREVLEQGPLPARRVVDYGAQICRGLAAAHAGGIVHRDLKPENLFLTGDGQIKILDFGLAKLSGPYEEPVSAAGRSPTATEPGLVVGTTGYMSPEQARGRPADPRSDLFAVGAVLYEMLSGRQAFSGDTAADTLSAILHEDPPAVPSRVGAVPAGLEGVVRRCLEKRPEDRFDSAHDLGLALETLSGPASSAPGPGPRRPFSLRRGVAGLGVVFLLLGGWLLSSRAPRPPPVPLEITPLTSDGGLQFWPQLSPDGEKVAYSWTGTADDNWDIYVKGLGPDTRPLRLTEKPALETSPVWSPDGRQIAFVRELGEGPAIYTVPWPSGQARRLIQLAGTADGMGYGLAVPSWSPDGDGLAFVERPSEDEPARIVRLVLATLEREPLTSPSRDVDGDFAPAFSPDGSQLAFIRGSPWGNLDLWVQPVGGREPRPLTSERYTMLAGPLAWTPEGDEILFTVVFPRHTILRVRLSGGRPQPVAGVGEGAGQPSIRGRRMVYRQQTRYPENIWRMPGRRAVAAPQPEKLGLFRGSDGQPAYSPDGRRIAFLSVRSGVPNVWVCQSDGSHPFQLTAQERNADVFAWSPDGRRIVFDSVDAGDYNLYVIDADGGMARRLTYEPSNDGNGTWSRDGRWIYFRSDRSGEGQIWKMPSEGGEAVQVTRGGGHYAEESWDGRHLYYVTSPRSGIWRVPVGGGEEVEVVPGPVRTSGWEPFPGGIYYATSREAVPWRRSVYTISFLDFESGQVTELLRKEGPFGHDSLAASPDEKWILFDEGLFPTSELVLVENFR